MFWIIGGIKEGIKGIKEKVFEKKKEEEPYEIAYEE